MFAHRYFAPRYFAPRYFPPALEFDSATTSPAPEPVTSSLIFPLVLPAQPGLSDVIITPFKIAAVAASPFTGKIDVQEHPGEFWQASVTVGRMRRAVARKWVARMTALRGPVETFLLGDPMARAPLGSVSTPLTLGGIHAARSKVILLRGFLAAESGGLVEGDYIQLGSGATARLHMALHDTVADSTGEAELAIFPSLRTGYADGTAVATSDCVGVFRLTRPISWSESRIIEYGIEFDCIEDI